jgi:hypothetical protein
VTDDKQILFGDLEKKREIERSIALLQENGYKVIPFYSVRRGEEKVQSLWEYFRNKVSEYHPSVSGNVRMTVVEERGQIKNYLKIRESSGLSMKQAFAETYVLIDRLFEKEPYMKLSSPIIDFGFILAEGTNWVISKILEEMYGEIRDVRTNSACFEAGRRYIESNEDYSENLDSLNRMIESFKEKNKDG